MIPEAIFAILACSKIGAVHNTIFSGFSSGAIATRLCDLETKILLTCNEIERRGIKINLQDNWSFASEQNKISKIIVVDQKEQNNNKSGKLIDYQNFVSKFLGHECDTEIMNSEDPLFILYTSGTPANRKQYFIPMEDSCWFPVSKHTMSSTRKKTMFCFGMQILVG
jgi:acetyl-CoA synthetase